MANDDEQDVSMNIEPIEVDITDNPDNPDNPDLPDGLVVDGGDGVVATDGGSEKTPDSATPTENTTNNNENELENDIEMVKPNEKAKSYVGSVPASRFTFCQPIGGDEPKTTSEPLNGEAPRLFNPASIDFSADAGANKRARQAPDSGQRVRRATYNTASKGGASRMVLELQEAVKSKDETNSRMIEAYEGLEERLKEEMKEHVEGLKNEFKTKLAELEKKVESLQKECTEAKCERDTLKKRRREDKITVSKLKCDLASTEEKAEANSKAMNTFSTQQNKFTEARLKKIEEDMKKDINEVLKNGQEAKNGVEELRKKVESNTMVTNNTRSQANQAKAESRAAFSQATKMQKEGPWYIKTRRGAMLEQIRQDQTDASQKKEDVYSVHIRVRDEEKVCELGKLGRKIDEKFGKGTVKFSQRTKSGHIKFLLNSKKVAESSEEWIKDLDPEFTLLDTTPWAKGVAYGMPTTMTTQEMRLEIETRNNIKLKREPRIMKEAVGGRLVILCFENEADYAKCSDGVIVDYQRFKMKPYYSKSPPPPPWDNNSFGRRDRDQGSDSEKVAEVPVSPPAEPGEKAINTTNESMATPNNNTVNNDN